MDIKKDFCDRIQKEVDAWKAEDQRRQDEIDELQTTVDDLAARIARDMETTGATSDTAAAELNKKHAENQIAKLEREIDDHAPLYAPDDYYRITRELAAEYKAVVAEKKAAIAEQLRGVLDIMDEIRALRSEATQCQGFLDGAFIAAGGEKMRNDPRRGSVGTYVFLPATEGKIRDYIREILRGLEQ